MSAREGRALWAHRRSPGLRPNRAMGKLTKQTQTEKRNDFNATGAAPRAKEKTRRGGGGDAGAARPLRGKGRGGAGLRRLRLLLPDLDVVGLRHQEVGEHEAHG